MKHWIPITLLLIALVLSAATTHAQQTEKPGERVSDEAWFWFANAHIDHGFTEAEAFAASGLTARPGVMSLPVSSAWKETGKTVKVLPYPGVQHPRIGFLEGAIDPMRGTKVSVFAPWDETSYFVVDVPEALFSNLGLTFLAHTHIPTIWDDQGVPNPVFEWERLKKGVLEFEEKLPNGIVFGARVTPEADGVSMEQWLENGTKETLTGLRTQVCVLTKGAKGFEAQTGDNKSLEKPVAVASHGKRHVLTAWTHCGKVWENSKCPCFHSDPVFPDCAPGETVRMRGVLRFYEGDDLAGAIAKVNEELTASPSKKKKKR